MSADAELVALTPAERRALAQLVEQARWHLHHRGRPVPVDLTTSLYALRRPVRSDGVPESGEWLSTEQVAELLGITARAVRKRIEVGTLEGRRLGRGYAVRVPDPEQSEPQPTPNRHDGT